MKRLVAPILLALALLLNFSPTVSLFAAENALSPVEIDLHALIEKYNPEGAGHQTLSNALAEFDALSIKYKDASEDDQGTIAFYQAVYALNMLNDSAKAREILVSIPKRFPDAELAAEIPSFLEQLDAIDARESKRVALDATLIGQPAPELHFLWSTKEGVKKLSDLRGQVVVIDFWATWCGPCIHSFPEIREEVEHFADEPVTFLGVTSLQGTVHNLRRKPIDTKKDPQKEMALMPDFMKKHDMTWDVVFSEEEVFNDDYGIEGIPHMVIIAPDGTLRYRSLHPADPEANITWKIITLLEEFGLR